MSKSFLLGYYLRMLQKHPVKTQSFTTGVLMGTGDLISQLFIEKKTLREQDPTRTTRFFLFGSFILGPLLSKWYVFLQVTFTRPAPVGLLMKIAADQLIFAPSFLCFFLGTMTMWSTLSTETVVPKIKQDYTAVLLANYKLWPAAQMINFYVVPLQHRVLFANFVALFWNTYLAYKTSREVKSEVVVSDSE